MYVCDDNITGNSIKQEQNNLKPNNIPYKKPDENETTRSSSVSLSERLKNNPPPLMLTQIITQTIGLPFKFLGMNKISVIGSFNLRQNFSFNAHSSLFDSVLFV